MSEQASTAVADDKPPVRSGAAAFIFVTILLDMLALGLILPILPKLVESFVDNDTATAARIFGLFGTAWALMQFLFSPILGALSDRFGRRPVVLLSNFGLALDYVLMALAPSLSWLFIGRVISGITSASISTSFAYIADITAPEKRAAVFGKIGAAFGAGFILGPAIGGLLGGMDPRLPFWVAAGLGFANALYGLLIFAVAPTGPLSWLGIPVIALWGVSGAAIQALMTRLVASDQQGRLQGATSSVQSVAQLVGPFLFTLTFAYFIGAQAPLQLPGA